MEYQLASLTADIVSAHIANTAQREAYQLVHAVHWEPGAVPARYRISRDIECPHDTDQAKHRRQTANISAYAREWMFRDTQSLGRR